MSDFADLRSLQIILCRLAKSAKYLAGRFSGRNFQDERWPRLGGGGLGSRSVSWATGVPAGGCAIRCSPHTPRRFPRGWEGQGSTRVRLRAIRRVLEIPGSDCGCHFRPSKHYFRPTLALRRARQASDPAKLIEVEGQDFFSGSAAVAAGHLVSADPARGSRRVLTTSGQGWAGWQVECPGLGWLASRMP